mmetsp:Transcript_4077/g.12001  ORF Transcript_4077/g.12001 Transcript_4077/m.12001 type:complete len:178 (-) Transcript_4077:41-574(-)
MASAQPGPAQPKPRTRVVLCLATAPGDKVSLSVPEGQSWDAFLASARARLSIPADVLVRVCIGHTDIRVVDTADLQAEDLLVVHADSSTGPAPPRVEPRPAPEGAEDPPVPVLREWVRAVLTLLVFLALHTLWTRYIFQPFIQGIPSGRVETDLTHEEMLASAMPRVRGRPPLRRPP